MSRLVTAGACGGRIRLTHNRGVSTLLSTSDRRTPVTVGLSLLVVGAAVQTGEIVLPPPSGPRPVGVATYRWTDSSRVDSLSSPPSWRTVLARVWYPARPTPAAAPAPYADHLDAAVNDWTALHARVRTHSAARAPF